MSQHRGQAGLSGMPLRLVSGRAVQHGCSDGTLTNYSIKDLAGQSMGNNIQAAEIDHTSFPINCQAKLWIKS